MINHSKNTKRIGHKQIARRVVVSGLLLSACVLLSASTDGGTVTSSVSGTVDCNQNAGVGCSFNACSKSGTNSNSPSDLPMTVCGSECPAGYYASSRSCSPDCGTYCIGKPLVNSTTCSKLGSSTITVCNDRCPYGYHLTEAMCSGSCSKEFTCPSASPTNAVKCDKD